MRHDGPVNTRSAALLEPRLVGDVEGTFFVRDYQRGYRWGADEVRRLLDDIKDAGSRNYYLQPVVVKRLEDGRWELVDGQQRLTTLYLVLQYIQRHMPAAEVRYTLSYETRPGSAAYLDSPTEAASFENIDYFPHISRPRVHRGLVRRTKERAPRRDRAVHRTLQDRLRDLVRGAADTRVRLPYPLHPPQRRAHPADGRRARQGAVAVAD